MALLVLAVAAGCAVTAVHVDHGLRAGSADRGGGRGERSPPGSVPAFATRAGRHRPRAEPRGQGPRGALRRPAGRRADRPHRRRPGRDRADQPAARCRAAGWPAMRPGPRRPDPRACAGPRRPALCSSLGIDVVDDPSNRDPRLPAQPGARTSCCRCWTSWPAAISCRSWPARPSCSATTPTCSTSSPPTLDPTDAQALRRRAAGRWPGEPCARWLTT